MEVPRLSRCSPESLAGLGALLLGLLCSGSAGFELVLLHTNDVHARVEETSVFSGKCSRSRGAECFGGVARRATLVRRVRGSGLPVLLLDAGDQFQGSVWFSFYKGAEAAHFMNALRYDAMALGNHEFDNGVPGLMEPFLRQLQCPVLSANIRTDPPLTTSFGTAYSPYKVLSVGGERVGIVGYTSRETPALSDPGIPDSALDLVQSWYRLSLVVIQSWTHFSPGSVPDLRCFLLLKSVDTNLACSCCFLP
uniref:5'-nucleotidase n=1 Tax=Periophthalmus magnuspinnatus TaxID=409849 RepID=A0A3B4B1V6_9GOBI